MTLKLFETQRIVKKDKLHIAVQCNAHEQTHVIAIGRFPANCPGMAIASWIERAKTAHLHQQPLVSAV